MKKMHINLQRHADAGTLVNATGNYVNAYTGATTSFDSDYDLSPLNKTFYDTTLLDNARDELIFTQLGKKQSLPANKGRTIEFRRWKTLGRVGQLTEGVIPTGKKMSMVAASSVFRTSSSLVRPAAAPSSSVAPSTTSSMAWRSITSLMLT